MITAVTNVKGGVGKTTLATNIAVARAKYGREVLLIDTDLQHNSMDFTAIRSDRMNGDPGYTATELSGPAIRTQVRRMANKYDDIILDVGQGDTTSLRAALLVADIAVIPTGPRSYDVWTLEDNMRALVQEARELNEHLKAIVVINQAPPSGKDTDEAMEYIRNLDGFILADSPLVSRKCYANLAAEGKSVIEGSDAKARHEFCLLMDLINIYA